MTARRILLLALLCVGSSTIAEEPTTKKPISEEEAREFCDTFAEKFAKGDGVWLSDHLDIPGMAWRATDGRKDGFAKGFRNGASEKKDGVLKGVSNLLIMKDQFEDYRFRHLRKDKESWKGLFRLLMKDGAMNFHELELVRKANGEVGVSEFDNYMTGETLTETFRGICRDAAQSLDAKNDKDGKAIEAYDKVARMSEAQRKGEYKQVLELYRQLPEHLQKTKMVSSLRLQAAANLDEKTYLVAMEEYAKNFPNDPSKDFVSIDAFFLSKNYDQARAAIDRLIERTGGDGHLSYLKATLYSVDQKPKEAIEAAREGIKAEDDYEKNYDAILNASLETKEYGLTKEMLEALGSKFAITFNDLTTIPVYADFVKSPEFAEWIKNKESSAGEKNPEF